MFFTEENTYKDILEKSVGKWLEEMEDHEDIAVRGGVKATRDYINELKRQIKVQEEKNALKDEYLKKMKNK